MARTSLAQRMSRLEQQKARIAEQEARIKTDKRKARTRRLIEAGGLVEKAGLLGLEVNALYGALLSLASGLDNAARMAEWVKAGGQSFDREAKALAAGKEPLTIIFPAALPTSFSTRLRAAGLRWNKVLHHWEGLAEHAVVAPLADEQSGTILRLRPAGTPEKS